jgi:hypothetical protein
MSRTLVPGIRASELVRQKSLDPPCVCRYRVGVMTEEPDWWSILRTLDEPVEPLRAISLESVLRPVDGKPGKYQLVGSLASELLAVRNEQAARSPGARLEMPFDFDIAAARGRFDRLAERLSEAFDWPCSSGLAQDSACFGTVRIPAEASRSRTKRTRIPLSLLVSVSSFGGLACYRPLTPIGGVPHVHADDRHRISEALAGLGYLIVPEHILATPYDGPNGWVFEPTDDATWYTRFFDYL